MAATSGSCGRPLEGDDALGWVVNGERHHAGQQGELVPCGYYLSSLLITAMSDDDDNKPVANLGCSCIDVFFIM
jgi:hypothetical protein